MARAQFPLRILLKPVVSWFGRLGRKNAPSLSMSCAQSRQAFAGLSGAKLKTDAALWDLFFTPYIWAGLRFRDVSRLWTGAAPSRNEAGQLNSPAQIQCLDDTGQEIDSEQLRATRWLFDKRLQQPLTQTLKEICYAKLILKKSVHEILWVKETEGEYAGKIVIDGFRSVDPTLFEFNPTPGYAPGLYLRRIDTQGHQSLEYEQVDPRRFLIVTNHPLFDDQNGISELEPLRETEPRRADAETAWGRGAQRHGHGHIIGYYGPELLGIGAESDRNNFQEMLENISSDTVSMAYEGNEITELNVAVNADVFQTYIDELKTQISLVLTGSPLTLKEGKFGSRSMAESTQVRQESEMEQEDCAEISAAFTEQVIRRFCDYNWIITEDYPKMQIIAEEFAAPTTPDVQEVLGGDLQQAGTAPVQEGKKPPTPLVKFQAEELPIQEPTPPVAIPAGFRAFPNETPLSQEIQEEINRARNILEAMPTKRYREVSPEETSAVFTIKRFRGYTSDMLPILEELKSAIAQSLDAKDEKTAWNAYYQQATGILSQRGIYMSPQIRNDLMISFRQARQNVFNEAIFQRAQADPAIVGLRIRNTPNDHHHETHPFWNGIAIPKDHPELQQGGRLRIPMDFGCLCTYEYVYSPEGLTAPSAWPTVFPGDTYRYYVPQEGD